ncbi:pentapeptide repeat-containing protein [Lentzea sp. NPDC092896]|uniref:pentapeptide repeat-containing protein n=1 Tax=Lentzea sp. NPDC092896 TaxID=3364127 RepID=UPI0038080D94
MRVDLTSNLVSFHFRHCHVAEADFRDARFVGNASFASTRFDGKADLIYVHFDDAWFDHAEFEGLTWFYESKFVGRASFAEKKIEGRALFRGVKFATPADIPYNKDDLVQDT